MILTSNIYSRSRLEAFTELLLKEPPGGENSAEEKEQQRSSCASGHRCTEVLL